MSRWIRELCGRRLRRRVVFRGRDVEWIGIRCLKLGIPVRASAGYISGMPVQKYYKRWPENRANSILTLRSSQVVNFLTPSPTSLKPSLASSSRSCTRSLTRSVSRFVPRRFICWDSRPILDVSEKSCSERCSLNRLNSGSSRYSGSSLRRYVVGCVLVNLGTLSKFKVPYLRLQRG